LLALLYYREPLHFIQPFSLTFAALPPDAPSRIDTIGDSTNKGLISFIRPNLKSLLGLRPSQTPFQLATDFEALPLCFGLRLASSARNRAILPLLDGYLSAISPHQAFTINAIAYR
jgi:hypothetical protein